MKTKNIYKKARASKTFVTLFYCFLGVLLFGGIAIASTVITNEGITTPTGTYTNLTATNVTAGNLSVTGNSTFGDGIGNDVTTIRGSIVSQEGFGSKLWNNATQQFETATYNIEYISLNQDGGIYGTIYRQYFLNISLPTDLTSGNKVSNLVNYKIIVTGGGNRHVLSAYTFSTDENYIRLIGTSGNNNLLLVNGSVFTFVEGWVDYTK